MLLKTQKVVDITIQPIGSVSIEDLVWLRKELERKIPVRTNVLVSLWRTNPPLSFFNWQRMQYRADILAQWLYDVFKEMTLSPYRIVLGIVGSDGYVENLNFVFGIALPNYGIGLVFDKRLRSPEKDLYRRRLLKESLHEIGHLLGLEHCTDPSCVMSFSNSIIDVDRKRAEYCKSCKEKLIRRFS